MSAASPANQTFTVVQRPKGLPSDDVFKLEDVAAPKAGAGQIVSRALFTSVDPYLRNRLDLIPVPGPMVSGQVGEVVESQNDKYKVGDHVFYYGSWSRLQVVDPSNAESQLTLVSSAVPLSAYLGIMGMPGATAYFGLKDAAQFKVGDIVLVSGAAGAVGSAVGQLAKLWGAKLVIGTAGGPAKCKLVTEKFGFDACIDYKQFDNVDKLRAELKRIAPEGIDVYYDNVGGFTSEAFYDCVRKFSRVAICGQISVYNDGATPKITSPFGKIIYTSVNIRGFLVFDYLGRWAEFLAAMTPLVKEGKIQYEETIVSGFEKLPSALRGLFEGANVGKMVVKI